MPIVPSAPDFVASFHVVNGERDQREPEAFHQIDNAVLPDVRIGLPGLRVEDGHVVPRRHDNYSFVPATVGPVREPAASEPARRFLPADALIERIPAPEGLACLGINRVRVTPIGRDGEEPATGVQRRSPIVLVVAVGGRIPLPCDL
jgi:hypothetical protein